MTEKEKKELERRINEAKKLKISVVTKGENGFEDLGLDSCIRGVYGFFALKDGKEEPFYIGKSNNIFLRMFGKTSHLGEYLREVRNTFVHKKIENYCKEGYCIQIRVLKVVEYKGDSFEQDANRLALAE